MGTLIRNGINYSGGGCGATSLQELSDTNIENPVANQVLKFDGENWVNGSGGSSGSGMIYESSELDTIDTNIKACTCGNGKYVFASVDNSNNSSVYYSTDLRNWTQVSIATQNIRGICFGGGVFVAVFSQSVMYSTDAITWTSASIPRVANIMNVAYGNGRFVVAFQSDGYIMHSTNGSSWTLASIGVPSGTLFNRVVYAKDRFIICCYGDNQVIGSTSVKTYVYSTNGTTWTSANLPTSSRWQCYAYANGKYIITGDGVVAYSTDGTTWTHASIPILVRELSSISNKFIAVNNNNQKDVYVSDNGTTWTKTYSCSTSTRTGNLLNDAYVIFGVGKMAMTYNGESWNPLNSKITQDDVDITNDVRLNRYSLGETVVGTWIDGRPIYQRTFEFLNNPLKQNIFQPHGISNLDFVVDFSVFFCNKGVSTSMIPNVYMGITVHAENIEISTTNTNTVTRDFYATIRYVKTTD